MSTSPVPSPPEALETIIKRQVDAAVDAKIAGYQKIIRAFLLGFGLLVTLLAANRLLSTDSLLVLLHDQIFGFDKRLTSAMSRKVNFSYSNQFWLWLPKESEPAKDAVQNIPFYANKTQKVIASIEVKHRGVGPRSRVSIELDGRSIWEGADDLDFRLSDLTDQIQKPAQFAIGENVHLLMFRMDDRPEYKADKVFVRVLTNIFGLEQ